MKDCNTRWTCLLILSALDQQPPYVFMADETLYYFVALSAPMGIDGVKDIYFQTTGIQMYYTANCLPPAWSMISDINSSCSMSLPSSQAVFNWKDRMHSCSHDGRQHWYLFREFYDEYFNYSSSTTLNPVHNIAKLVTLLTFVSLLIVTTVVFCICCSKCRVQDHPYQNLPKEAE